MICTQVIFIVNQIGNAVFMYPITFIRILEQRFFLKIDMDQYGFITREE